METQYVCAHGAGHAARGGRAHFEQAGMPCSRKRIALRVLDGALDEGDLEPLA